MNLAAVLSFLEAGVASNTPDPCLKHLQIDSRQVNPGDLFLAVPGLNSHGNEYIQQAIVNGAAAIITDLPISIENNTIPIFVVPHLVDRLAALVSYFYANPAAELEIIAITGTNGKTSCSHYIAQILSHAGLTCGVMGTLGNGVLPNLIPAALTTSDVCTIQRQLADFVAHNVHYVAMEASSHSLTQNRLAGLTINTAVFTNLSQDHLDYHGDMQAYFAAKAKLFTDYKARNCVINLDDAHAKQLLNLIQHDCCVVTYSLVDKNADIYIEQNKIFTPWGDGVFTTPLIGKFNLYNLMACVAVCGLQGLGLDTILAGANKLIPVAGRMQRVQPVNADSPLVVIDYAHTPDALVKSLSALREYCSGKLYCVFGCGGDRDRTKRPLMLQAVLTHSDVPIITQDNPRTEDPQQIVRDMLIGNETNTSIEIELDRAQAINNIIAKATRQDAILIAGKGHEDYQIIGTQKFPFSDLLIAQQALAVRGETICMN